MSGLLDFVFSPDGVIAALLVAGVWTLVLPRSTGVRRFLLVVTLLYAVAGVPVVPSAAARWLARGYREFVAADVPPGPSAIVLLGGGGSTIYGWNSGRIGYPSEETAARVLEAARVFRLMPKALVVSSGGIPSGDADRVPAGVMMRDWLVRLGVPAAQVLVESESRDTHDEAMLIAPILRERHIPCTVLITSAAHMRRAVGAFRAQGADVVPAIAPHAFEANSWIGEFVPSRRGLNFTGQIVHELFGLAYYRARRWLRD